MLTKQARVLSQRQIKAFLIYIETTRHPLRNKLIFLLSLKAGLRAKEIASITWRMVCDENNDVAHSIKLENSAAKGKGGGVIPLSSDLRVALCEWRARRLSVAMNTTVISTDRSSSTSAQVIINMFSDWYSELGFEGCSSHSGRRTFITSIARKISFVGGSMRDVQALARHSSLSMTQRYIETNSQAQRDVVQLI